MRIGLMMFPTDLGIQPIELARETEARGFDSLWFPEHSHIPTPRRTPMSGRAGAPPLLEHYKRAHDQFVALAAAAAVTTTLKLGSGICLAAQHDHVWLAKQVASIDVISGGRFTFGVGYGWNHEEMESHGLNPRDRRKILREKVLACKEIWTKEVAEYHGEFVNLEPSWSWPKPLQSPHPPIAIGGSPTPVHFSHMVEFGDIWIPTDGRWPIGENWLEIQQMAADAGRDPGSMKLGVFSAGSDRKNLEGFRDLGALFATLWLPALDRDEALAAMDSYAELVDAFNR